MAEGVGVPSGPSRGGYPGASGMQNGARHAMRRKLASSFLDRKFARCSLFLAGIFAAHAIRCARTVGLQQSQRWMMQAMKWSVLSLAMTTTAPTAVSNLSPAGDAGLFLVDACRSPRVRTLVEFAEQEVVLPTGQYKGQKWRAERQPWVRLLFEELDSRRWIQNVITGPTQSGKTQAAFTIPILHQVFEEKENTVIGLPDDDMGNKKYKTDLLPIMLASPNLSKLVPESGKGSRGGTVKDEIEFTNSVIAALMTRGASDEGKAGFTARYLNVTEAGGFSVATQTSTETNPLRQLLGRLKGFKRHQRRAIIEGTVKLANMLPWSLRGEDDGPVISSQSQLVTPCPHCGVFNCPEREDFKGHENAITEDQAVNESSFFCPYCGESLSEEDRKVANRDIRLVHRGQTINQQGDIEGDLPPTSTLWFRYTQWHNLLSSFGDIAAEEWEAAQSPEGTQDRDDFERALQQQTWCIPFESSLITQEPLVAIRLRGRGGGLLPRNTVPADTIKLTMGVDIGKQWGWWILIAWRESGQRYIVGFSRFQIMEGDKGRVHDYIVKALDEIISPMVETGFACEGDGMAIPDSVWIDGGYHPNAVAEFVKKSGPVMRNRYKLCRGRGEAASQKWLKRKFTQPKRRSKSQPLVGRGWYAEINFERGVLEYTFDADMWKLDVHSGLRDGPDRPNGIAFWRADSPKDHDLLSQHLTNEQLNSEWKPGKGEERKWLKEGQNHGLDCAAMASVAGEAAGVEMPEVVEEAPELEGGFYAQLLRAGA